MIHPGRHSARLPGDFVVFLIGARINRLRRLPAFVRISRAMGRMQRELLADPELGCLHIENFLGRTSLSVQYWRSFSHLESYARAADAEHLPAWRDFNRRVRDSGDVGIWHETYEIREYEYEAVYGNMPRFGLARAGDHFPLGRDSTAAVRSGERTEDRAPVEAY